MLNTVTGRSVAARLRMLRTTSPQKAILLVEGGSDAQTFGALVCPNHCSVQPAHGRPNAIDALDDLDRSGFNGLLVLVDQDDWVFTGRHKKHKSLLWSDGRDLESTLLRAGVGVRILAQYGDKGIVAQIEKETGRPLLDLIAEWSAVVGVMRWISQRDGLGLRTNGVNAFDYVDQKSLEIAVEDAAKAIVVRTNGKLPQPPHVLISRVTREAKKVLAKSPDAWLFCSGHDLCHTMVGGLIEEFGRTMCSRLTFELLEAAVRAAIAWSDFEATALYEKMRAWEKANKPYRIFSTTR